jgi:hypothetical protein
MRAEGKLALVLASILMLASAIHRTDLASSEPIYCVKSKDFENVRKITLEAIDIAYKDHVSHLFTIWIKDPNDQPSRATKGMTLGLSAYFRARANALQWNPPICEEK